jgi:hypothetical protein
MRHHNMKVDNYLAVGGNLSTLRYSGVKNVENDHARATIEKAFAQAGKNFDEAGSVEVLPENPEYANTMPGNPGYAEMISGSPFLRGIQGLFRENEDAMGDAEIRRIVFTSEGREPDAVIGETTALHLVSELGRVGDG